MSDILTDHPNLRKRLMACEQINGITVRQDGTIDVAFNQIYTDGQEAKERVINCDFVGKITVLDESKIYTELPKEECGYVVAFEFIEHYSQSERAKLHEDFLNDEYDWLGDLPEY